MGKSSDNSDVAQGEFFELVPGKRIVQRIVFESEDPAFAGAMIMTWHLDEVPGGTQVTIVCENVPEGIRQKDHEAGMLADELRPSGGIRGIEQLRFVLIE
jgi:uncharacterized protein YndB with AHSA1/START domain